MRSSLLAAIAATVLLAPGAARAAADYDTCTGFIDALPAVISTPGTWCLRRNLATTITSGAAIEVTTDDVKIDCNGFRIVGTSPTSSASGIKGQQVMYGGVRNCSLQGFGIAIWIVGAGTIIEKNRVVGTHQGIIAQWTAFSHDELGGPVIVRDNDIVDVPAIAIDGMGFVTVERNRIIGPEAASDSRIVVYGNESVVRDNVVRGAGRSGIQAFAPQTEIVGNVIIAAPNTADTVAGISCRSLDIVRRNVVSGFAVGVKGCTGTDNLDPAHPPETPVP